MNTTRQTHGACFRRAVACVVALLVAMALVGCFQAMSSDIAFAATKSTNASKDGAAKQGSADKSKGDSAAKDASPNTATENGSSAKDGDSGKKDSKSLSVPESKKDSKDDKKSEGEKKRKEAAEKRASASALYAQAGVVKVSLDAAQAECDAAAQELDEANAELDETKVEYDQKTAEIESLQEDLSEYVVDMYKQGGSAPYLDVILGSTSYREFLTSWNMAVTVGEYGDNLVVEKKRLREEIERKVAECEERVKSAERNKSLADANRRQLNATRLAYLAEAAQMSIAVANLENDKGALQEAQSEYESVQKELEAAIAEGLAGESLLSGGGYFTHPCPDSTVSSGFGYRSFDNAVHKGIDFAAAEGTPYYAADSGIVTAATNGGGDNGGAGNWIVINHGNGIVTKYMHSLITFVKPGDRVERGQNIGLVGTTGQSTGPHLHFQVEFNGVAVNPTSYL